jgi:hypothetical protein
VFTGPAGGAGGGAFLKEGAMRSLVGVLIVELGGLASPVRAVCETTLSSAAVGSLFTTISAS